MLFAMLSCVLIALEPQSTKRCDSSLVKLKTNAAKSAFAGWIPFLVTKAGPTVRGTFVHHIYHILGRGTKDEEICFSSSVYIANVRFFHEQVNKCIYHTNT